MLIVVDVVHFVAWFSVLLIQYVVHLRLTRWLPRSFTLGEAAVVSQGFTTFTVSAGTRYKNALVSNLLNVKFIALHHKYCYVDSFCVKFTITV